ncbi:translation initiation factor IF-3, mitochondrial [Anolis carolinensis]|nr:PREDICTED: translation initiation factor IF-3, mitochondrial [Anolis carolinensis]|eukprot:XP_003225558.1 PREDICTED: translation initiation factor IF-3, mitochondrial [Anolis carolinensis]
MAALCLKKLLAQAKRDQVNLISRYLATFGVCPLKRTPPSQTWLVTEHATKGLLPFPTQSFCTHEAAEEKLKGKKINPNAKKTIESVGKKIPHRIVQLIDENGNNEGTMHRADVIRIMDERGLRLVLLSEKADPPVYRLMSGHQIHEERMKLREKQKANPSNGPVQQKEITLSTTIAQHDLDTKIKQIQQWIDKKHHVRVTVQQKRADDEPKHTLALFSQILDAMPEKATYLSEPRIAKEGRGTCVLRHMSEKEIRELKTRGKNKEGPGDTEKSTTTSDALNQ